MKNRKSFWAGLNTLWQLYRNKFCRNLSRRYLNLYITPAVIAAAIRFFKAHGLPTWNEKVLFNLKLKCSTGRTAHQFLLWRDGPYEFTTVLWRRIARRKI